MKVAKRKGVATIIATLIMVAAAALFTSIMLYWGSAYLGQSTTNMGSALFRSNNAATEQISIDSVSFTRISATPTTTYIATIYVRNFGDIPFKIAAVHITNLQSGASPPGYNCELSPHLTIVARATGTVNLGNTPATSCTSAISAFGVCYDGASISIGVNSEGGTSYQRNYVVPAASISIPSTPTYFKSTTVPSITITTSNVGCGTVSISSISVTGVTTNPGFKGSVTLTIPASGTIADSGTPGAWAVTDGTWSVSPNTASAYQNIASQGTVTAVLQGSGVSSTKIQAGDLMTVLVTTTIGTTATIQFTVV